MGTAIIGCAMRFAHGASARIENRFQPPLARRSAAASDRARLGCC